MVRSVWRACLVCGLALALAGCESGAAGRTRRVREPVFTSDVLGVHAYFHPYNPWIWDEARTRPRGIVIQALYLEGPGDPVQGVFGDGVIRPKMFTKVVDANGREQWPLVKEWAFDVDAAMPFRSKKPTAQGYGYALYLPWGDEVDVAGREIRMVVTFERADGQTITSAKKDFRVPGFVK
jgi:hypothetical protein